FIGLNQENYAHHGCSKLQQTISPILKLVWKQCVNTAKKISKSFFEELLTSNFERGLEDIVKTRLINVENIGTLYIHIPFCNRPCTFCCFVRYPYNETQYKAYIKALKKEIEVLSTYLEDRKLDVYVGGGTPTINIEGLLDILDTVVGLFKVREVSVEANPHTLNIDAVKALADKVDRLSIGVQSLRSHTLAKIGRRNHTIEEAVDAVKLASLYFKTVNVDLLWGLPDQDADEIVEDAIKLIGLGANQITFYPSMPGLDEDAILFKRIFGETSFDRDYRSYRKIYLAMVQNGFYPRTAWHFQLGQGLVDEYIVSGESYVGVGVSSISLVGDLVLVNTFNIEKYIDRINNGRFAFVKAKLMTDVERTFYDIMMASFSLNIPEPMLERLPKHYRVLVKLVLSTKFRREGAIYKPRNVDAMFIISEAMRTFLSSLSWFRRRMMKIQA
ncbi:MAG TPA: radical SAM protein, partial [Pyrodictium sp.]|nr:radical SAM protein [Pyrodictium sp.]